MQIVSTLDDRTTKEPGLFDEAIGGGRLVARRDEIKKDLTGGGAGGILESRGQSFAKTGIPVIDEALERVNPTRDLGNCGPCAIAYELQRRGEDVEARVVDREVKLNTFERRINGFKWVDIAKETSSDALSTAKEKIKQWGNGARGIVFGVWDGDNPQGHYFSFEFYNSNFYFVDAQFNKGDVAKYFDLMQPYRMKIARLDNIASVSGLSYLVQKRIK